MVLLWPVFCISCNFSHGRGIFHSGITYIHYWALQPFSQDYWPSFSHHLCCVCFFLYIRGGTSLKSTPNDRYFDKLFMATFIYSQSFARNLLRGNRRRNTFRICFWCLAWGSNPGFSSNKPTHYLLDHGDFLVLHLYNL